VDASPRSGIGALLAAARLRIDRLAPTEAQAAAAVGRVLLVDIRSEDERRRDGVVPGALHLPRTVLEWRVDPASGWQNPHVGDPPPHLVLLCTDGYSSSLAAATLVELGFSAGDVVGGVVGWRQASLELASAPDRPPGVLAGMHPPDPSGAGRLADEPERGYSLTD